LFVTIELLLSFWLFVTACNSRLQYLERDNASVKAKLNQVSSPLSFGLATALQLVIIIQLFNWISKRHIGLVIGLKMGMQSLGLASKFNVFGIWEYFPNK
jgi:hypothetical protein